MKIIINADDFGLSPGVNYGIIDAHRNGFVNSTTMLTNMASSEHAFELMKSHPKLGVGVHLVLSCGKPLRTDVPSLTNEKGNFKLTNAYASHPFDLDIQEVEREWEAQIDRFFQHGLVPTHLDSHHHIHGWAPLRESTFKLARKHQLPVRHVFNQDEVPSDVKLLSDEFNASFYSEGVTPDFFVKLNRTESNVVEVMCHPAFIDHTLQQFSSYQQQRVLEHKIVTTTTLPEQLELMKCRNQLLS